MKLIKAEKAENKLIPVKEGFGKLSASLKKNLKRNLIVMGSVLLIGGAVWLNWALFSDVGDKDYDPSYYASGDVQNGEQNGETNQDTNAGTKEEASYFAMAAIDRSRARDEAMEVLNQITASTDASEEARAEAYAAIEQMAKDIENEANIETLLKAKGFEECVAVISNSAATIIVKSEGLLPSDLAQITEIVWEQAAISPSAIKVIEKA
ncbi:MAG: SpoIIIAH-like family protein [Clostridia bacterium]|nr:SpoIIIAH-like family protein [Clostridia bacterium]